MACARQKPRDTRASPDRPGQLWFPTIEGPALLDVRHALALDSVAPRVEIVGLFAEGFGAQPLRDGMTLPRGARRVNVRFIALGAPRMHSVQYAYRIDALDREWIRAGDAREAVYSALAPGRYQLRVRAANEAGMVSDGDALLTFEVPAYFHETRWFIGLVLLATAVLLILGLQARERQLTERARLLQQAVHDRTTHLQVALDTVEQQANRLRALDETRSRILANVSHEFRTPLSLIIGPVDDLLTTPGLSANATARQRLGVVARNAQRLRALVEQLLDAARLDAGTMPITLEVHDLVPQLRHLTESYASLAERRHIRFVLSCPVGGLRVRCDPDHIEKIVGNLVGNALKFTPEGGDVELRASRVFHDGSYRVRLEVQDNGRGIAPMDHDAIFERFRQLDDSMQRAESGTGIGLALVKELVELHGGTVRVESAIGAGSTFIVLLPAEATDVHAVPSDATPASSAALRASSSAGSGPLAPPSVPRVEETERPTVLLVEDNAELREWLREHLARRYRVREAANGADALAMARNEPPDIIVSDVMMPIMDGLALCAAVRARADARCGADRAAHRARLT
jgi:signal transduction histidine kinase